MPLHLLSKKSWNVYAPANIERVKRDEAEAQRQAIEQERRSRQDEADDRIDFLKQDTGSSRKSLKRKLPGEDDTDRDIRRALEENPETTSTKDRASHSTQLKSKDAVDDKFALFLAPSQEPPRSSKPQEKDPYTVYLTDATGRSSTEKQTWYTNLSLEPQSEKWGDANTRKQAREAARLVSNDPLLAIQRGVKTLRENEKERKAWMRQRERDLMEVERADRERRRENKRRRKERHEEKNVDGDGREDGETDADSLDGFDLEGGYTEPKSSGHRRSRHEDHDRESRHRHHGHRHHHRHPRDHNHDRKGHTRNEHDQKRRRHGLETRERSNKEAQ